MRGVLTSKNLSPQAAGESPIADSQAARIRRADDGTVTKVGWLKNYDGFGLVIKVRHTDGIVTMYAHLAKALVRPGDRVAEGQLIAKAGCTGSCTGVHLHFQVWVNGKLTDPQRYLGNRVRLRG